MILSRPVLGISLFAGLLIAHPMGNFSVSHYTRFDAAPDRIAVTYALDLAEIPTFELLNQWKLERTSPQLKVRAHRQAAEWLRGLYFTSNGKPVPARLVESDLAIAEGAAGMPVLRITSKIALDAEPGTIAFEDRNYAERAGWKEIVIRGSESASHGSADRSKVLTAYPADPMVAPPQDTKAHFTWKAPVLSQVVDTKPVAPSEQAPGTVTRGDYLSRLLRHESLSTSMILLGLAVAFGLGAMHALSPGHGKTLVAAYLVGSRGTWKHAAFLGATVTFTHTFSVFMLGFVTLFLSEVVAPETLTPILGAISGLTIVWIGANLLRRRIGGLRHAHAHAHGIAHHHDHDHEHEHSHVPEGEITMASLIALGASGGLVPCPSALVLLLSSISLGRAGLGMLLLVAFSLGLAAVLTGIGLAVVYAKGLLPDRESVTEHPAFRLVPVLSAAVILCIGLLMTCVSLGIIKPERILG